MVKKILKKFKIIYSKQNNLKAQTERIMLETTEAEKNLRVQIHGDK